MYSHLVRIWNFWKISLPLRPEYPDFLTCDRLQSLSNHFEKTPEFSFECVVARCFALRSKFFLNIKMFTEYEESFSTQRKNLWESLRACSQWDTSPARRQSSEVNSIGIDWPLPLVRNHRYFNRKDRIKIFYTALFIWPAAICLSLIRQTGPRSLPILVLAYLPLHQASSFMRLISMYARNNKVYWYNFVTKI